LECSGDGRLPRLPPSLFDRPLFGLHRLQLCHRSPFPDRSHRNQGRKLLVPRPSQVLGKGFGEIGFVTNWPPLRFVIGARGPAELAMAEELKPTLSLDCTSRSPGNGPTNPMTPVGGTAKTQREIGRGSRMGTVAPYLFPSALVAPFCQEPLGSGEICGFDDRGRRSA
jgi:hypothetical protein